MDLEATAPVVPGHRPTVSSPWDDRRRRPPACRRTGATIPAGRGEPLVRQRRRDDARLPRRDRRHGGGRRPVSDDGRPARRRPLRPDAQSTGRGPCSWSSEGSSSERLYAGLTALFIFPLVAAVQRLTGLYRHRAVLATVAGGWTGVASVQLLAVAKLSAMAFIPSCSVHADRHGDGNDRRRPRGAGDGSQPGNGARRRPARAGAIHAEADARTHRRGRDRRRTPVRVALPPATHAILGIAALIQAFVLTAYFGIRWTSRKPRTMPLRNASPHD